MSDLYEQLISEGEAGIDRLIVERTQEGVQLDFKEKEDASRSRFSDNDRRTLGKALSAFSNSAGGLLVWGVEARRGKEGDVDCANAAKPISDIAAFRSEAASLVGRLLQPKHDGIDLGVIPSTRQPGAGYLAVRVARSGRRPHRSEAKGHQQYFKRSGDSSFMMEHYDIEDAFRRMTVPELVLDWTTDPVSIDGSGAEIRHLLLQLVNDSPLTAKYPYLHISGLTGAKVARPDPSGYQSGHQKGWELRQAIPGQVVNPGTRSTAFRLDAGIILHNGIFIVHGNRTQGPFMMVRYRYGCENSTMREGEIALGVEDLYRADRT